MQGIRLGISALLLTLVSACQAEETADKPVDPQQQGQQTRQAGDNWKTVTSGNLKETLALLESLDYTPENWNDGDRSIPRVFFTQIPKRWAETSRHIPVQEKKMVFLFLQAPLILRANELVLEQRAEVEQMRGEAEAGKPLTEHQLQRLNELAESYGEPSFDRGELSPAQFEPLLARLDIVPLSLALSQAAIESGWGTSRFATEGNALFGQWGWSDNVIKPKRVRKELGNYGVMAFDSPMASVTAYIHNINTHRAYERLRQERADMREQGKAISGTRLAGTLDKYSERGDAYVEELRSLISYNDLEPTDNAYLRDMQPIAIVPVGEGIE